MIKLAIIGGFLGAGKTTLILNLAKRYRTLGLKVGIVTNDQGSGLVDTEFLKSEGFSVVEVDGGCFCCNFDLFTEKIEELVGINMPDIILAEPVGSCTDLIATIFKPLLKEKVFIEEFAQHFAYAPMSIVVDPKRMNRVIMDAENSFPNEINYLFRKQLEEANIILLNKIDLLSKEEVKEMTIYLKKHYPGTEIIPISAKKDSQVEQLSQLLLEEEITKTKTLEIDYPIYGAAEAYLGWLNASGYVILEEEINLCEIVERFMRSCQQVFRAERQEIAHLKVYAIGQADFLKASLVSVEDDIDFNKKTEEPIKQFNLIVNARVNIQPDKLKDTIEKLLQDTLKSYGATINHFKVESFAPGYPTPKYRMT
ncbi:MAG: GTP-binding protein [Niameybacter sp.]